jgi:hypothetical protein
MIVLVCTSNKSPNKPISSVFPLKSQKCDFDAEHRCRLFATSAGKGLYFKATDSSHFGAKPRCLVFATTAGKGLNLKATNSSQRNWYVRTLPGWIEAVILPCTRRTRCGLLLHALQRPAPCVTIVLSNTWRQVIDNVGLYTVPTCII